jgi:hypothetical protein
MADETVTVTSLRSHTYDWIPREPCTQYQARAAEVATLKNQCMAIESATLVPPVTATGATAGTPGSFTPAGAQSPANLGAMAGLTANPATAWTTGQYVATGDAAHCHWNGTAWITGNAV